MQLTRASRRTISPSSVFIVVFRYWTPWSTAVMRGRAIVMEFVLITEREIASIPQGHAGLRDWNEYSKRIKQWNRFLHNSTSYNTNSTTKILPYQPAQNSTYSTYQVYTKTSCGFTEFKLTIVQPYTNQIHTTETGPNSIKYYSTCT